MRAVVQRVKWAKVEVLSRPVGEIGPGLLILLAVHREDTIQEVKWLARKIVSLRIFSDSEEAQPQPQRGRRSSLSRLPIYPLWRLSQGVPPQLYPLCPPRGSPPPLSRIYR